jgi:hypothetical protein
MTDTDRASDDKVAAIVSQLCQLPLATRVLVLSRLDGKIRRYLQEVSPDIIDEIIATPEASVLWKGVVFKKYLRRNEMGRIDIEAMLDCIKSHLGPLFKPDDWYSNFDYLDEMARPAKIVGTNQSEDKT